MGFGPPELLRAVDEFQHIQRKEKDRGETMERSPKEGVLVPSSDARSPVRSVRTLLVVSCYFMFLCSFYFMS